MACKQLVRDNIKAFLNSFDTILTDCDGVLWHGPTALPGVAATVQKLHTMGKNIFYLTNNSTKTRQEYITKCSNLGFPAKEDHIVSSGYVTAQYVKSQLPDIKKAFVVGSRGLEQELQAVGIQTVGVGPDHIGDMGFKELAALDLDPEISCVVVGMDTDFSYLKMAKAISYLQRGSCKFIATNADSGLPIGNGTVLPGTGAIVSAVQTAAGRSPDIACGKPSPIMFSTVADRHNIDPARTLMIGDRLNTDIRLAGNCGLLSLLVLSGFSSLDDARQRALSTVEDDRKEVPDYYCRSLADIMALMDEANM